MLSEKSSSYFTKRLISTQNIKCKENESKNLAWKDFRKRVKEKRSGGKHKSYYGLKKLLYFTDTTAFSRKLRKYKQIKSSENIHM